MGACLITEFLMTFFFLFIIVGTTSKGAASGFAGIPIGPGADADPSGLDPGHQHLGQSSAQHRPRAVRRR